MDFLLEIQVESTWEMLMLMIQRECPQEKFEKRRTIQLGELADAIVAL